MRLDRKTVRRYLQRCVQQPRYGPSAPRPQKLDPYRAYLRARLAKCPKLTAMRLLREIRDLGYQGGRTALTEFIAAVRPREATGFEHRLERYVQREPKRRR
jgi:transposase